MRQYALKKDGALIPGSVETERITIVLSWYHKKQHELNPMAKTKEGALNQNGYFIVPVEVREIEDATT